MKTPKSKTKRGATPHPTVLPDVVTGAAALSDPLRELKEKGIIPRNAVIGSATESPPLGPVGPPLPPSAKTKSPFELALIAAVLSLRSPRTSEQTGSDPPAEHWLSEAAVLVAKAAAFINAPPCEAVLRGLDFREYSFAELLERSGPSKRKKGYRTWVGEITTRQGLEIAIKRAFRPAIAERLIQEGKMRHSELEWLLQDLASRRRTRTNS